MASRERTRKGRRGASLIEFILVMGLLFMLLFGIMEIGFMLYSGVIVNAAANQGARAAALGQDTTSGIPNAINNALTLTKYKDANGQYAWDSLFPGSHPDNMTANPTHWMYYVDYAPLGTETWQEAPTTLTSNWQVRVRVWYGYGYITGSVFGAMANLASGQSGQPTTHCTLMGKSIMRYGG